MNTKKEFTNNIGIGVTEHNRPEVFKEFIKNIKKYMPADAKLVIVDDASEIPVKGATYRFEENAGIARAKNKCLELLQDCKHIFLFDSDCWPKTKNWYQPYVEGKEPHYCYIFKDFINHKLNDCNELYRDSEIVAYSHARGCMLYLDNEVLSIAGGMDVHYKRWGYEHVDYSNRIYNLGLTQFRYQDVPDSNKLIYSADEHQKVSSTVSAVERRPYLLEMKDYYLKSFESTKYCPFIETHNNFSLGDENIILTTYIVGQPDPQRGIKWTPKLKDLQPLIDSMNGQRLVILHDCFDNVETDENVEFVKVETCLNPYFQRWVSQYEYLRQHPEVANVFCVDATDVEMLKNPFDDRLDNVLYVGSEPVQTWNNWMIVHHPQPWLRQFLKNNANLILLNCGIVGGSREDVMTLMRIMNTKYFDTEGNVGRYEMGLFNWAVRTYFNGRFATGTKVHTKFKAYETNKISWFKHK